MAEQIPKLPDLDRPTGDSTKSEAGTTVPIGNVGGTTSTKEMVIAFGAVLAAAILFLVIKNYVSKMLAASYKKSPRSADMAGWSLFCVLLLAAILGVLGILDSGRFFSFHYLIPIGLAMLASLVTFVLALVSKR